MAFGSRILGDCEHVRVADEVELSIDNWEHLAFCKHHLKHLSGSNTVQAFMAESR